MNADDRQAEMLSELTECAYRLGLAFGAQAEQAGTSDRRLEYFHLFDRCFASVRMAIALRLRLRRPSPAERVEREAEAPERPERERAAAYDERDRERDREAEPASLPLLLRTLEGVATAAEALPDPPPAALPTLRELLSHVKAGSGAPARPSGALRARLTASGATSLVSPNRTGPAAPKPRFAPSVRRATGPPSG